jgi:NAD+ diphosphatase
VFINIRLDQKREKRKENIKRFNMRICFARDNPLEQTPPTGYLWTMPNRFFIPQRIIPESHDNDYVFPFHEGKIALSQEHGGILRRSEIARAPVEQDEYFGQLDEVPCFAQNWDFPQEGYQWIGLRQAFDLLSEDLVLWAGRGKQILQWLEHHQFCGRCGHPTEDLESDWGVQCPSCALVRYPRINPAVIVAITKDGPKGQEILLVKKKQSLSGFHALIAGFVETGESLEEGVRREAREEVGVELGQIAYWGSQSWPFPDALMVGFTAQYLSGELRPDGVEIESAGWYTKESLPMTPPRYSLASKMLTDTLGLSPEKLEAQNARWRDQEGAHE